MSQYSKTKPEKDSLNSLIELFSKLKSDALYSFQAELKQTAARSRTVFQSLCLSLITLLLGVALAISGITSAIVLIGFNSNSRAYFYAWGFSATLLLLGLVALFVTSRLLATANMRWSNLVSGFGHSLQTLDMQQGQSTSALNSEDAQINSIADTGSGFEGLKNSVLKFRKDFSQASLSVFDLISWGTAQISSVDKILRSPNKTPWLFLGGTIVVGAILGTRSQRQGLRKGSEMQSENSFRQSSSLISRIKNDAKIQVSAFVSSALLELLNSVTKPRATSDSEQKNRD